MDLLTRRNVRHELIRRRNERIVADRDDRWPLAIFMHPETVHEVLMDADPAEAHTLDFEGKFFMNVPLIGDERLAPGEVRLQWPVDAKEAADG